MINILCRQKVGQSIKTKYKPTNPDKYMGNPNNIICRSNWERKFCSYCDRSKNILAWGSEELAIPYISPVDNRVHKYYPDFIMKVKEATGNIKTYIVEVKPKRETKPPKRKNLYEMKTYAVNQAKWKAAREFCADRKVEFIIITEDELGIKYR